MAVSRPSSQSKAISSLYDEDYLSWLTETARLLRSGQMHDIDVANLAEELDDMGRSEKRSLESNLEVLLRHLLKYQHQPERRSNSWRFTILEHRDRIDKAFRDSPSLKPYFTSIFADCYALARKKAAVETGLPLDTFPEVAPFSSESTLNPDFLPGE
ncbi:DUF29 domain-containing protein [Nodosilinea sp. LEGE 07088]|uniref:DUF29 domain-containing protein n=1 Tax=Nodosilinea sp. LEGE 07088 TaxID=2777968 RepID=UPI00187F6339|nr:DUF29 domain-containing protein [Nodosilinea sp. LEGE 07088]MBE9139950.1 DUF29 domain-containing protein [Nodosilinea sp. LEGE 07088]